MMIRDNAQVGSTFEAEIPMHIRQSHCSIVAKIFRNGKEAKGTGYTVSVKQPT
jgi:hypothetical protein